MEESRMTLSSAVKEVGLGHDEVILIIMIFIWSTEIVSMNILWLWQGEHIKLIDFYVNFRPPLCQDFRRSRNYSRDGAMSGSFEGTHWIIESILGGGFAFSMARVPP